jgi:DNA-3-methyladenine glycosylase I
MTSGDSTPAAPRVRCPWPYSGITEIYQRYHDEEWGSPVHDDRLQFEFLVLEGAQAGLSWATILNKRSGYRESFADFDIERVAAFGDADVDRLLQFTGIVRNRLKIESAINNARRVLELKAQSGSFDDYLWSFVEGHPQINHWREMREVPANSSVSDALSRDLRKRGFKFVGSTIVYAHMQAVGMVNDHLVSCFRHRECIESAAKQRDSLARPESAPNSAPGVGDGRTL